MSESIKRVQARAQVQAYIKQYGSAITIQELYELLPQPDGHLCPVCKGKGTVPTRYNAYPSGLPDSGWAEDWRERQTDCGLCGGEGYTKLKMVPNMVQDGWKVEQ